MKKWFWAIGLVAVLALSGCIKMDQDITLNKDGSGNAKIMLAMSQQTIQQFEAMAAMSEQMAEGQEGEAQEEDSPLDMFKSEKVKKEFEELKDQGITLNSVNVEDKEGWKYVYIDFDFEDIGKLQSTDMFEDQPVTITRREDGNYVITAKMSKSEMGAGGEQNKEQMKAMLPMFKGLRIAMKFNTPGDIISTTAPIKEARSAQWVFDVDKDPDSFLEMDQTKMEIVFDGAGCTIPEVQ